MKEYVVLDNNGGYPEAALGNIPANPEPEEAMLYLERTTKEASGKLTSTVATDVTTLATNFEPRMFKINIPWSMSILYENMSEKTKREYDKVIDFAISKGIDKMFYQKQESADTIYIPQWDF